MFLHLRMNLAYKKTLGQFTKVLGIGRPPPPCWENSQSRICFLSASLHRSGWIWFVCRVQSATVLCCTLPPKVFNNIWPHLTMPRKSLLIEIQFSFPRCHIHLRWQFFVNTVRPLHPSPKRRVTLQWRLSFDWFIIVNSLKNQNISCAYFLKENIISLRENLQKPNVHFSLCKEERFLWKRGACLHKWGGLLQDNGWDCFSPRSAANYNFATAHLLFWWPQKKPSWTSPPVGKRPKWLCGRRGLQRGFRIFLFCMKIERITQSPIVW